MNYNVKGLNELSKQFHQFQIDAGFTDNNITQRLMLVVSEVSEAFEAFRKDKRAVDTFNIKNIDIDNIEENNEVSYFKQEFEVAYKDTLEDEMADTIIRILAFCGENGIDIEKHIKYKMKYNELRGYKYGWKKF